MLMLLSTFNTEKCLSQLRDWQTKLNLSQRKIKNNHLSCFEKDAKVFHKSKCVDVNVLLDLILFMIVNNEFQSQLEK